MNRVELLGNVGNAPEIKQTASGRPLCRIHVATNYAAGEESKVDWHDVVCFDRLAELVAEYVYKGRKVFVEGRLAYRKVDDRYVTNIIASDVRFL